MQNRIESAEFAVTTAPAWSAPPIDRRDRSAAARTRPRILILSDAIPDRNGVGTYYRDLVGYLEEFVAEVEMIPAKSNCCFKQQRISLRVPGDHTQRIHFPHVVRISRRVREMQPDLILAPTLGPFGLLAYVLARRHRIRLIVGHHTAYEKLAQLYWDGWRAWFCSRCLEGLSTFLIRSADAVVVNANEMAAEAVRVGAKSVHCVGTTVAELFVRHKPTRFPETVSRVLYAGRLAAEKNIDAILDAAEACPHMTFRIAGEGPERAALEARARTLPNVAFLGWLSRERLLTEIDGADLLVLPSHIESFGSVALEGMARGRLVLVSRQCGILEWPELAGGLYCIREGEDVAASLRRIAGYDAAARLQKARTAYRVTQDMNERTLAQWLDIVYHDPGHG